MRLHYKAAIEQIELGLGGGTHQLLRLGAMIASA